MIFRFAATDKAYASYGKIPRQDAYDSRLKYLCKYVEHIERNVLIDKR